MGCSLEIQITHLPRKLTFEILTFLLLGYFYETTASLFEILAAFFLEWFYTQFSAVFNDFDIAITNWEVLAFYLIRCLFIITLEFIRGKTADATVLLLLSHHTEIIILYLVLLILFNHQAQVFDLPFDLLTDWASWLDLWCSFVLFRLILWATVIVHQILLEWRMNIVILIILIVSEIEISLWALHHHSWWVAKVHLIWMIALWKTLNSFVQLVGLNRVSAVPWTRYYLRLVVLAIEINLLCQILVLLIQFLLILIAESLELQTI